MDKFKDLECLADRPEGFDGQNNGKPLADEIPEKLTDDHVVEAYKVPWAPGGYHLQNADADFDDAVWNMGDGRRDIRQMKSIPEIGKK